MSYRANKDGNASSDEEKNQQQKQSDSSSDDEAGGPATTDRGADETTAELIRKFLPFRLGFLDEKNKPKVLEEVNFDGIIKYIKDGKAKRIITMAGAGISTSAGIPDFRSPGSGLYHNLEKYNLPDPQAIFDIEYFRENPKPFFVLAKELYPNFIKPTPCHYFIRLLHEKGLLLRHFTQNIDALERLAGTPVEALVEAHGTFLTSHCTECHKEYPEPWMREKIFADAIPECTDCPGVVKPDIVFFGEQLPDKFYSCVLKDFPKADLLIVMGSSLVVEPFASLINRVNDSCPRLLINRELAGQMDRTMAMLGLVGGMDFSEKSRRDVAWLGDCDDGCQLIADKLGWGDELKNLVKKEHARMDKERAEAEKAAAVSAKEKKKKTATVSTDEKTEKSAAVSTEEKKEKSAATSTEEKKEKSTATSTK